MKYITKEIFLQPKAPAPTDYGKLFEGLSEIDNFINEKLGKDCYYESIRTFKKEDIDCLNGCQNKTYYITNIYFTEDKQKRILDVKCIHCAENFLAYQENVHE